MADSYTRRFAPNKLHIIAAVLLIISALLLINGLNRAGRVTSRRDPSMFSGGFEEEKSGTGMLAKVWHLQLTLKGAEEPSDVCILSDGGFLYDMNVYVSMRGPWEHERYMFAAVRAGSKEEEDFLAGNEVTCYFSDKYNDEFEKNFPRVIESYDTSPLPDEVKFYKLGLIVTDRDRELRSLLYFLPFLIAGLIVLKKAGSPYFYFPDEKEPAEPAETE